MPKRHGAWNWRGWTLAEARRQQQLELFVQRSVDPRKAEAKRRKKRRKRQADQPGIPLHD
jgi:hypothetical protein